MKSIALYAKVGLFLILLHSTNANGQADNLGSIGTSPFSRIGIGDFLPEGGTRQQALGSAGVGSGNSENINLINPAMLYYNRVANFEFDSKVLIRQVKSGISTRKTGNWTPAGVHLVFPITRFLTLAAGIRQHAATDYASVQNGLVRGDTLLYGNSYSGDGSLSQVQLVIGAKIYKGLTAGVTTNYWLGTISKTSVSSVGDFAAEQIANTRIRDVQFRPGLGYRGNLGAKTGLRFGLGITTDLPTKLRTEDNLFQTNYVRLNGGTFGQRITYADTLINGLKGTLVPPATTQVGIMLESLKGWTVVLDLAQTQWKDVRGINIQEGLQNTYKVAAGIEWVPSSKSTRYLNIVTYRAGFRWQQLPYSSAGQQLDDKSLSLGVGVPVIRKESRYSRPVLNGIITVGRRGTTRNGGLAENYINFTLGVILNDNLWFQRYKIE